MRPHIARIVTHDGDVVAENVTLTEALAIAAAFILTGQRLTFTFAGRRP